jgi:uncharacterized membrane protein SpoIIM required for sporulation
MLGSAILFPGTYARGYYVVYQARQALKIILGVTPFIVFAAVIESYVTRQYQDLPGIFRLMIILGTLALMLWYLLSLPKHNQHAKHPI